MESEKRQMERIFAKEACIPEIVEGKLQEAYEKISAEHKEISLNSVCDKSGEERKLKMSVRRKSVSERMVSKPGKVQHASVLKVASILIVSFLVLGISTVVAVAVLGGYEVEKGGKISVNQAYATMAGVFAAKGSVKLENEEGIYCFEVLEISANTVDYDYSDYVWNKFCYPEKTGTKRYAYIRVEDERFAECISDGGLFAIKCEDEEEQAEGVDREGNPVKVRLLKLSGLENLSKSGFSAADFGVNDVHLNAEGYLKEFVADSDFLSESFDMGIYEFKVLHSTHEGYTGRSILVLCPKDFAAFLEENKLGLNLRGVRCYHNMEYGGRQLWSIVSAESLDYDHISVEKRLDLVEWYVKGLTERFTDGNADAN